MRSFLGAGHGEQRQADCIQPKDVHLLARRNERTRDGEGNAIAQRDKKLRATLRSIAGSATGKKAKAILLMDGTRNQTGITSACGIDKSDLSGLVKKLRAAGLLTGDPKEPKIAISIPPNFFEEGGESE